MQAFAFLAGADLFTDRNRFAEGRDHEIATGDGNLATQARTFGADRFLKYLYEHHLLFGEYLVNLAGFDDLRLVIDVVELGALQLPFDGQVGVLLQGLDFRPEVGIMQEGVFFVADIDEGGVEGSGDALHAAEEYVPDGELIRGPLPVDFHQFSVFQQGNFNFLARAGDDHFFFHCSTGLRRYTNSPTGNCGRRERGASGHLNHTNRYRSS